MIRRLWRKRRWALAGAGVLLLFGLVGWIGAALATHRELLPYGLLCVYHGAKAWLALRHHHPLWSGYHLWRATHDCRRAAWRY